MLAKSTYARNSWLFLVLALACGRESDLVNRQAAVNDDLPEGQALSGTVVADEGPAERAPDGTDSLMEEPSDSFSQQAEGSGDDAAESGDLSALEEAPIAGQTDPTVPATLDASPTMEPNPEAAPEAAPEAEPDDKAEPDANLEAGDGTEQEPASEPSDEPFLENMLVANPVVAYAPRVYLHPKERDLPMAAAAFIANSSLRWSHDRCGDHPAKAKGSVSAAGLGKGTYKHQIASAWPLCRHHGKAYHCNEHTRPREAARSGEGFFLDLDNSKRRGQGADSPVYFDYQKNGYITYWFFYGYNDGVAKFNHEGDWERISIRLSRSNRPTHIAYYQHNKYCVSEWAKVEKYKGHPIVYSAKGSHASYPNRGKHFTGIWWDYTASGGKIWQTWRNLLVVRAQPWYGFGGAWGEVGESSTTTGPLGPSAFKGSAPSSWSLGCH